MKNLLNAYIVTAADYGDGVDGKPRVLLVAKSMDEAEKFVADDMDNWAKQYKGAELDSYGLRAECGEQSCEWNIENHYIEL